MLQLIAINLFALKKAYVKTLQNWREYPCVAYASESPKTANENSERVSFDAKRVKTSKARGRRELKVNEYVDADLTETYSLSQKCSIVSTARKHYASLLEQHLL